MTISIDPSQGDTSEKVLTTAVAIVKTVSTPVQFNWNGVEVNVQKEVFISSRTIQVRTFSEGMNTLGNGAHSAYFKTNGIEVFMKRG